MKYIAFCVTLACGALCIWAGAYILSLGSDPDLSLYLVQNTSRGEPQLLLRFVNKSKRDIVLSVSNMEYLVYSQENDNKRSLLQADSKGNVGDTIIKARSAVNIGNLYQLVRNKQDEILEAVYIAPKTDGSDHWHGVLRSPPIRISALSGQG